MPWFTSTTIVLDPLQGDAADDAVAQFLDDLPRFDDRPDVNAFDRAAVVLGHDHVLGYVHQTPGQIAGIGRLQCGVGQSFTCPVGGDEVLEHRQAFAEVGRDGCLNHFA
jgi:hypothetical protein